MTRISAENLLREPRSLLGPLALNGGHRALQGFINRSRMLSGSHSRIAMFSHLCTQYLHRNGWSIDPPEMGHKTFETN